MNKSVSVAKLFFLLAHLCSQVWPLPLCKKKKTTETFGAKYISGTKYRGTYNSWFLPPITGSILFACIAEEQNSYV